MVKQLKLKKYWWVLIIMVAFLFINQDTLKKTATTCTSSYCADFNEQQGTVSLIYGANEDDAWDIWANNQQFQSNHKLVGTRSLRVWVSAQWYRTSSFPETSKGNYNWVQVDKFINAALKSTDISNPPLYITLAHGDRCASRDANANPYDFSGCEGHGAIHPQDMNHWGDYVATVVTHFRDMCNSGGYVLPCNVNDWYFEIWNEPTGPSASNYGSIYSIAVPRIKSIAPGAKIASYDNQGDYRVAHLYANIGAGDFGSTQQRFNTVDDQFNGMGSNIINSEYNYDWADKNLLATNEAAGWYAAALIRQIYEGTHMEHFYSGTSNAPNNAYGLWGSSGQWFPTGLMKQKFVTSHPTGSIKFHAQAPSDVEILATSYAGKKYITLVNKNSGSKSISLQIKGIGSNDVKDRESGQTYNVAGETVSFTMSAYDVKFLEVTGGATCTDSSWVPSTSTICSGQSYTQTSNCGNTRTATGTMDCSSGQQCTMNLVIGGGSISRTELGLAIASYANS